MSDERIDALIRNFDKMRDQLSKVTARVNEQEQELSNLRFRVADLSSKRPGSPGSNPFTDMFGGKGV